MPPEITRPSSENALQASPRESSKVTVAEVSDDSDNELHTPPESPGRQTKSAEDDGIDVPALDPNGAQDGLDPPTSQDKAASEPIKRENEPLEDAADSNGVKESATNGKPAEQQPSKLTLKTDVPAPSAEQKPEEQSEGMNETGSPTASRSPTSPKSTRTPSSLNHNRKVSAALSDPGISEFSHQILAPREETVQEEDEDGGWQEMPAFAQYDMYDDDGKLVAKALDDAGENEAMYAGLGGAGKGYTKVTMDDDAESITSIEEHTAYLFKEPGTAVDPEDEDMRDPLEQMQATKDLLTDNQRIAYVGLVRLAIAELTKQTDDIEKTRSSKKAVGLAVEHIKMWSQMMMVRLYSHMDLESAEQLMIEQLAEHGLQPGDLAPALMKNARVKNPMAAEDGEAEKVTEDSNKAEVADGSKNSNDGKPAADSQDNEEKSPEDVEPLPPYQEHEDSAGSLEVKVPSELPDTANIDIDLRWTVLCDLFLVLIADSAYDARSRVLLERVGSYLAVSTIDICRFEKRVTEALEMQEDRNTETWDEAQHMEMRRKLAKRRRLIMMGIATAGGALVIGLSAGLLGPVIGAGLAAGFTTIGVSGTGSFLGGAAAAGLIGAGGVVTGGTIGVRAAHRRTGHVKTFEYRPLHNNKRVNLIVTISGWLTGKVDDVRLPFSTVDPVMGDIYSLWWEPEMLTSMGQTLSILATEALTQAIQQILGSTILIPLMAALQLPIILSKLSYLVDNPWSVSVARADRAGLILADSLIDRNLGARPITLVGYSIGSRVIYAALQELARKGAVGLVQNVFLFGSPTVAKKDDYLKARTVVAGRFVNGFASNDWILAYLFRATSGGVMRVAGLAPVEAYGIENIDVTDLVPGHMAYRKAMPKLLRRVGWLVESDDFVEIEDPDPDNHEKRQRELINEIEEARRELEQKPEKRKWWQIRRKNAVKKSWEIYDDRSQQATFDEDGNPVGKEGESPMFDVDAIRQEAIEIAAQGGIEVKELESTLPPLKLDSDASLHTNGATVTSNNALRTTKSEIDLPTSARDDGSSTSRSFDQPSSTHEHEEPTMSFESDYNHDSASSKPTIKEPHDFPYDDRDEWPEDGAEENPTMTFESPSNSRPFPTRTKSLYTSPSSDRSGLFDAPASRSPGLEPPNKSYTPERSPSRSSAERAAPLKAASPVGVNRNVWADDDEFAEKEMEMTFE